MTVDKLLKCFVQALISIISITIKRYQVFSMELYPSLCAVGPIFIKIFSLCRAVLDFFLELVMIVVVQFFSSIICTASLERWNQDRSWWFLLLICRYSQQKRLPLTLLLVLARIVAATFLASALLLRNSKTIAASVGSSKL